MTPELAVTLPRDGDSYLFPDDQHQNDDARV
jgi:hypothetical protein